MKILYIATARPAGTLAAHTLRGIAPDVLLTWTQSLRSALHWVHGNPDAAAIIIDAEVEGQGCASFVKQVRSLGLTMPVVVVAPEHLGASTVAVSAGADDDVAAGPPLHADLPRVVTTALQRTPAAIPVTRQGADSRQAIVERGQTLRELEAKVAEAEGARQHVDERLARAEEDRRQAEQRCALELAAAEARLANAQARHKAVQAREGRICTALQRRLLELEAALRDAEERRASEAAALAEELAKQQAEFTASLTRAAHWRDALAQKLSDAMAAVYEARQARTAEAAAAAEHLARREAELGAALAEAVAARTALEHASAEAEARHRNAQHRAAAHLAAAAEREAALDNRLAQETAARTTLEHTLATTEAARRDADDRHATELAAAMRLAAVQAQHDAALAEAVAARTALEHAFAEAEALHQDAQHCAAAALAAAARREAALEERLAQETAARTSLEHTLATTEAARREADDRHTTELAAAAVRLAELQAQHDAALAERAAARDVLESQLTETAAALEEASQARASEAAAAADHLARREAELDAALAEAVAAKAALEHAFAEAEALHQDAQHRTAADLAAAAGREAALEERLAGETATRIALERDLADSRMESARARRRFLDVVSAHRRRSREHKARLEAQLTRERADSDRTLAVREEESRQLRLERDMLQQMLGATRDEVQRLHSVLDEERQGYERARLTSESEVQRLSAECDQLRQSHAQLRTAFNTLEHLAGEHAMERARLESVVAERNAELRAQAARHLVADQAAQDTVAELQERLRVAVESSSQDLARLQRENDALRRELDAARACADALRSVADLVPALQTQLEETQREKRRQFERALYGLCHCTREGVITHVNHSLAKLLGCRRPDDLRGADFAAVFECAGDLGWLIERAVSTGRTETVETTWNATDRRRLVVRLQALATSSGSVEIVVEDITDLRTLEQRLRRAQRMEAVGRLASEIAGTCDTLLHDVIREGEQWLAGLASDSSLRHQGELLLDEVTRAAGLLRRLAAYGNEELSTLEPVSVQRVIRDLEPVLKRLMGDDIELLLPKPSASLEVDVEARRVERILVTVASHARARMPYGGQVKIDVATTVIGRRFIARYPNVRRGAHVLITITEVKTAARADVTQQGADGDAADRVDSTSDKPGADLGVLLELISTCGGHLWMEAEPAGNMTLKIHLPKRGPEDRVDTAPATRSSGGRPLARWFRINSPAAAANS